MEDSIDAVIDFIVSRQNADGSFSTYELYPVVKPNDDWSILPDSSPFITANILYSLMQAQNKLLAPVIKKGTESLWRQKERGEFWRFWPIKSRQHPVPLDIDDTSICSFVLERAGYKLNNKQVLLNNVNAAGYFKTWLAPNFKTAITSPLFSFQTWRDCIASIPTVKAEEFAFDDYEPAVAANALLYLGDNTTTLKCADLIIEEVQQNALRLQFYADEVIVYHFIARAYYNGAKSLEVLDKTIADRLKMRFEAPANTENVLLTLMAAIALLDFNTETALAKRLIQTVATNRMVPDKWKCVPYFASKNRNFLAGSPELTAALYIEAYSKMKRL